MAAIVVAAVGSVLYGILLLGWIPIKLVLVLLAVGAFTVWALVRSVFAKRAEEPDRGAGLPTPRRLPCGRCCARWRGRWGRASSTMCS